MSGSLKGQPLQNRDTEGVIHARIFGSSRNACGAPCPPEQDVVTGIGYPLFRVEDPASCGACLMELAGR